MALITDGILTRKLPWTLVLLGVFDRVVLELGRVPSLPFAVGVYLPLSTSDAGVRRRADPLAGRTAAAAGRRLTARRKRR